MIKIEKIDVYGFESAIRGMRNPMNSWDRSDSVFCASQNGCEECPEYYDVDCAGLMNNGMKIGSNDLDLMQRLFKGGTEHRKYLRFIDVTMDITAPLYWWKEWDTYKIGTNCNSCSTMHKIHAKEFTLDDFSFEHIGEGIATNVFNECAEQIVDCLNEARRCFLDDKNKAWWRQMIQLLPSSYNQRRTVKFNYEVAVRIIQQRKSHKLDEWHVMCDELMNLPYMKEIMGCE